MLSNKSKVCLGEESNIQTPCHRSAWADQWHNCRDYVFHLVELYYCFFEATLLQVKFGMLQGQAKSSSWPNMQEFTLSICRARMFAWPYGERRKPLSILFSFFWRQAHCIVATVALQRHPGAAGVSRRIQDTTATQRYSKCGIVWVVSPTRTEHNFALKHVTTVAANVELRIPGSHGGVCHWLFCGHLPILSSFLLAQLPRCTTARNIWTNMNSMNLIHWCCVLPFVASFLIFVDSFHLPFCNKLPS